MKAWHPISNSFDENMKKIRDLLKTDRNLPCRNITEEPNISKSNVQNTLWNVLKKIKVYKVCPTYLVF